MRRLVDIACLVLLTVASVAQAADFRDHLGTTTAQDFVTLAEAFVPGARTVIEANAVKILNPEGEVQWRLEIEREESGRPRRMIATGTRPLDLTSAWSAIDAYVDAKREAYRSLTTVPFVEAEFTRWLESDQNVTKLVAPVQIEVARYLFESLRHLRTVASLAETPRQPREQIRWDLFERWAHRAENATILGAIGLIGWGAYTYFNAADIYDWRTNFGSAQKDAGAYRVLAGFAVFVLYSVNSSPLFFGDYATVLDKILRWTLERRETRANRREQAAFEKEITERRARIVEKARRVFDIGGVSVTVDPGDLTLIQADAWLIPEFNTEASRDSVGHSVLAAGGEAGLDAYDAIVATEGPRANGTVTATEAGTTKAKRLYHVTSIGERPGPLTSHAYLVRDGFTNVKNAVLAAIEKARAEGLSTLAAPLLGVGVLGNLDPRLSAQAMLEAIHEAPPGPPLRFTISTYGPLTSFEAVYDLLDRTEKGGVEVRESLQPTASDRLLAKCATELRSGVR